MVDAARRVAFCKCTITTLRLRGVVRRPLSIYDWLVELIICFTLSVIMGERLCNRSCVKQESVKFQERTNLDLSSHAQSDEVKAVRARDAIALQHIASNSNATQCDDPNETP